MSMYRLGNTFRQVHSQFYKLGATVGQRQCAALLNTTNVVKPVTNAASRNDEIIVISGISGRFPQSESMDEFKENLYSKIDMVTEQTRFKTWNLPRRFGFLKDLDKFDSHFFGVNPKLAHYMDPQQRKLLEVVFEAIIDAGINPRKLRGSSTAVFVGAFSENSTSYWMTQAKPNAMEGHSGIVSAFALANRISFVFDLKGPSYMLSAGCSSSLIAIEAALQSIRSGRCDAAVVAACTVHTCPFISLDFNQVEALSSDGSCKSFDAAGDGFARSEAVVAILIQKQKDAKRSYATVKNVESNADGYKDAGLLYPSGIRQKQLFIKMYAEAGIDPGKVKYIEAHGTGTPAGDPQEVAAISSVFCQTPNRTEPLLMGSVKSNMGHGESAAGLCGLAKVIIGIQEGQLAPNLHFNKPRKEMEHLFDGSLQVVTETTPFSGGIVAINSFGVGGTNAHLILETRLQNQEPNASSSFPIILPFSGRTEDAVKESLKNACEPSRVESPEFCGLVHNVFKTNVKCHPFRGFALYNPTRASDLQMNESKELKITVDQVPFVENKRPICFVFSGMGSQWNEMGLDMQKLDVFRDSFKKSKDTLKNIGVDLEDLLKPNNPNIFNHVRHASCSIAAVQIALFDTLISLNIFPDILIGHSFGEIMCGYADGSFTAEETLRFYDALGKAGDAHKKSLLRSGVSGTIASVGLCWEELESSLTLKLPVNVYLACRNSGNNTTISGESTAIKSFVSKLKSDGIFAQEIICCNFPAHCPLIYGSLENYTNNLSQFYSTEKKKLRSGKWMSSSIPLPEWGSELSKYNSIEYHANCMKMPVLFQDSVQLIPEDAVVIEIAPKEFIGSIIKANLSSKNFVIAPMTGKSGKADKVSSFLTSIGKMYNNGIDVDFSGIYPPISFPVAASTPGLSSLVRWNHDDSWSTQVVSNVFKRVSQGMRMTVDLSSSEYQFLKGHKIDGRFIFPGTGYLKIAWEGFACHLGVNMDELPVFIENVVFQRATYLTENESVDFYFTVSHSSGQFEIKHQDVVVASGNIRQCQDEKDFGSILKDFKSIPHEAFSKCKTGETIMQGQDVYKELYMKGLDYSGAFQGIKRLNLNEKCAEIKWNNNWIAFLDTVLQSMGLLLENRTNRELRVPVRLRQIKIYPQTIHKFVNENPIASAESSAVSIPAKAIAASKVLSLPGLEVHDLTFFAISRDRQHQFRVAYEYKFCPYFDDLTNIVSLKSSSGDIVMSITTPSLDVVKNSQVAGIIDLVLENGPANLNILDVFRTCEISLSKFIHKAISSSYEAAASIKLVSTLEEMEKLNESTQGFGNQEVVESFDLVNFRLDSTVDLIFLDTEVPANLPQISFTLKENSFLVLHSSMSFDKSRLDLGIPNMVKISEKQTFSQTNGKTLPFTTQLFKKKSTSTILSTTDIKSISIYGDSFEWLSKLQELMKGDPESKSRLYLTCQLDPTSGILGFVNCLMKERKGKNLRCIFDPEKTLELNFDCPDETLSGILEKDLVMNVVKNGKLGSYRHFPVTEGICSPTNEVEHAHVKTLTLGNSKGVQWIESPLKLYQKNDHLHKLCKVHFTALNFKDVMLFSGKWSASFDDADLSMNLSTLGMEFSGIDPEGRRVMGIVSGNGIATSVLLPASAVWKIPDYWTLEEAATVPVVYTTAYYALHHRVQLQPGQSILIHSGTGGMGQAAINLALAQDCEIYTTVGNDEKRHLIKTLFPTLIDENIFSSRDCEFETKVMERTSGRGVDIVLDYLSGDKRQASLRCVAKDGKFLEMGNFGMVSDTGLRMNSSLKNIDHIAVDGATFYYTADHPAVLKLKCGIENGDVKPLKRHVFNVEQVEDAFRFMTKRKHMGKVLIKVREVSENNKSEIHLNSDLVLAKNHTISTTKSPAQGLAIPQTYLHHNKTYIIAGGLGGLGFETAIWLAERGAKKLILTSRSGLITGYHKNWLKYWVENGIHVKTPKIDLSNYEAARNFLKNLSKNETIGGIFNSCLVLKDALIEDQTVEMFQAVTGPKVNLTKNLDQLSREFCPELDYFAVFSSIACGRGNEGQSNYGLANSVMERICEKRKADGLHGLAIQWGPIGETGYAAYIFRGLTDFQGLVPQSIESCLEVLDGALNQNSPIISCHVLHESTIANGMETETGIVQTVAKVFGIKDLSSVHPNTKLSDLGMDSLIVVEIQRKLDRMYNLSLDPVHFRSLTFGSLLVIEEGTFTKGAEKKVKAKTLVKK